MNTSRFARRVRAYRLVYRLNRYWPWMNGPVLNLVTTFWLGVFDEGPYETLKPRWGVLTFHYLNDGIKPTAWHTFMRVLKANDCIYIKGAPKFPHGWGESTTIVRL